MATAARERTVGTDASPRSRLLLPLLVAMLFVTGACGLIYQQLWLRELSLVFGVTVHAAATVLAAFMAGLALGSWLAGRLVDRARRPLAWFGTCEILVGLVALVTPAALGLVEDLYVALSGGTDTSLGVLTLLRLVLGFSTLLLPATLMGASMPIVIRAAVSHSDEIGARTALLYSVNTTGAIVGTLLAGFVWIGEYGVWNTFVFAAIGNITIGLVAVVAGRTVGVRVGAEAPAAEPATGSPRDASWMPPLSVAAQRAVLAVFVVSGFVTLALEIVWFRVLVLYLESNTYAFSAMLAAVLAGIAIGSAVVTPFLRRRADWYTVLIVVEALLAVVALASLGLLAQSYSLLDVVGSGYTGPSSSTFTALTTLLVVFPSALLLGIAFPIGVLLWANTDEEASDAGRRVGIFYAGNLVGAIAGSLVAGFVLIPVFGSRVSVVLLCALILGSVVLLVAVDPARARLAVAGVAAFGFLVVAVGFVPDPSEAPLANRYPGQTVVWSKEGVQTTVSIQDDAEGQRAMYLDGLPQASTAAGPVELHRMIGTLPMALHPKPENALVVGLGGGVTAGALAVASDADVRVVELSDEVIEGASFYKRVNHNVTDRDNVTFRVDDGRNFLLLTDDEFDVITADIIQPQHAGAGKVWSVEYWRLVRDALAADGVFLQWIGRDRPDPVYRMMVRSFLEVFPNATLWDGGQLLVGTKGPLRLDPVALEEKLTNPRFAKAFGRAGLSSADALLGRYTAGPDALRRFAGDGPRLTDDRPRIEYYRSLPSDTRAVDITRLKGDPAEGVR